MKCNSEHEFSGLWKKDGKNYSVQVLEIPGIAVGGKDSKWLAKELKKATKAYLSAHEPTHVKAEQNKLGSTLSTSSRGIILKIEKFSVKCKN